MIYDTKWFITKAKKIHGDRYSYELTEYINAKTKVKIICPEHGVFEQKPYHHIRGHGCMGCSIVDHGNRKRKSAIEVISSFKEIHGDKYSYKLVEYKNRKTKVKIICPIHGVFEQIPGNHLNGSGCYDCGRISIQHKQSHTTEQFITKAKEIHGDKYSYDQVKYVNNNTKVRIICPEHGVFEQRPNDHLNGRGCQACAGNTKLTTEQFITKAKEIHGDRYSYKLVEYVNINTKVKIICPNHAVFEQRAKDHLNGRGCAACAQIISKQEIEFTDYIKSVYDGTVITNTRDIIQPYELDVYLPNEKIAFEYNGTYWHNEGVTKPVGYHDMKTNRCKTRDITLYHIWEKDWMNNREGCKEMVFKILGVTYE